MMDVPLLKSTNYISGLTPDLWIQIVAFMDPVSNLNMRIGSKRFCSWYDNEFIPPKPISQLSTTNQYIDYLDKMERCHLTYSQIPGDHALIVPNYQHYQLGLKALERMSDNAVFSIHFNIKNGCERVTKLCNHDSTDQIHLRSFWASCFRDPYQLLAIITIMLLVTVSITWLIAANVSFNANDRVREEDAIYQDDLQQNMQLLDELYHIPSDLMDKIIPYPYPWISPFENLEYGEHYHGGYHTNRMGMCFVSEDDMCQNINESSKHLEFVHSYYRGAYSMKGIRSIYSQLINYACTNKSLKGMGASKCIQYLKNIVKFRFDAFRIGWQNRGAFKCVISNGTIISARDFDSYAIFYILEYRYDLAGVAKSVTQRPHLAKPIGYLIVLLVAACVIFIFLAWYGLMW